MFIPPLFILLAAMVIVIPLAVYAWTQYAATAPYFDWRRWKVFLTHQAIVQSMEDGMMVLDKQNRILEVNPAAQNIIQRPAAELVGETLDKVWPDLTIRLNGTQCKKLEITREATESSQHFEISASPLYDWRNRSRGRVLILRDVTQLKALEEMRNEMTRTMVHDLRAPISNALFALQMLKGDLPDDAPADSHLLLDLTFANTEKTLQLVNQILDITHLESGQLPLSPAPIYLADIVNVVIEAQAFRAADKQLRLVCNIPDTLPPAWGDAGLLERVLQNLVDNSIKFTPAGGTIQITVVEAEPPSTDLLISVSDSGPGIPADLKERIFEKYVVGPKNQGGNGLGLAFCQMALAAHGQNIWLESHPGEGTTLSFSLARAVSSPAVAGTQTAPLSSASAPTTKQSAFA